MAKALIITVAGGDELRIEWTGSVWCNPQTGEQFALRSQAAQAAVRDYLLACGVDADVDVDDYIEYVRDDEE